MPPKWGEVWNVDFGNPIGHEQGAHRPAVIVSSDWFNGTKAELHVVVPVSKTIRAKIGTHLQVHPPDGGLDVPSDVMCEHIRAVSVDRFTKRRGVLSDQTMDEVMKRLKVLLMLGRKGVA
jgi:mRNA interferase MazF